MSDPIELAKALVRKSYPVEELKKVPTDLAKVYRQYSIPMGMLTSEELVAIVSCLFAALASIPKSSHVLQTLRACYPPEVAEPVEAAFASMRVIAEKMKSEGEMDSVPIANVGLLSAYVLLKDELN